MYKVHASFWNMGVAHVLVHALVSVLIGCKILDDISVTVVENGRYSYTSLALAYPNTRACIRYLPQICASIYLIVVVAVSSRFSPDEP